MNPFEEECKHTDNPEIVKFTASNGHVHVRTKCPLCGKIYGNPLPKRSYSTKSLPSHKGEKSGNVCIVSGCNSTKVELHHFFPRSLANSVNVDPDDWPTAYLCDRHHKLWHAVVTPGLDWRTRSLEEKINK